MGRILLFLLIVITIIALWRAFGPTLQSRRQRPQPLPAPDDNPDFLWTLKKERFKERRAREEAEKRAAQREAEQHERARKQREEKQRQNEQREKESDSD